MSDSPDSPPPTLDAQGRVRSPRDLGHLIRSYRKQRGILQTDAAALAGVRERFLGELERGLPTKSIGLVLQVLDRFGLEVWVVPRGQAKPLGLTREE